MARRGGLAGMARLRLSAALAAAALLGGCALIEDIFPPPLCSATHYTTVFEQATAGDVAGVRAALDRDSSIVRKRECDGDTLLHDAVQNDQVPMTAFLLDRGARIEARNSLGMTPLHVAATNDRLPMLTLLVSRGAKVNPVDRQGWTPLDRAEKWHNREAAEFLRAHGGRQSGK
jgi:ankyrin repeat protein